MSSANSGNKPRTDTSGSDIIPYVVTLESNSHYRLCQCFKCDTAPSAAADCRRPLEFSNKRQSLVWLCSCGRSKQLPYCDGAHNPRNNFTLWQSCCAVAGDIRHWWLGMHKR